MRSNLQLSEAIKVSGVLPAYSSRESGQHHTFSLDYLNSTPYTREVLQYNGDTEKHLQIKDTIQDKMHNLSRQ